MNEIKQQAGHPDAEPILIWARMPETESSAPMRIAYLAIFAVAAYFVFCMNVGKPAKAEQQAPAQVDVSQVRLLVEAHKAAYRIADVAEPIIYK